MKILEHIRTPEDLRNLPEDQLPLLAAEMRQMILETVSRNGGHFASNFGVVELTIALHRVFHTPDDVLIWDVGHQSYCHKLLTGRQELFQTLRQMDGCAPFQSRRESPEYDPIGGGHAGTAISAALGIQTAAQQRGEKRFAVAILGDGALTCGISLEALNNVGGSGCPMVIVLNDNRMSISSNVGGLPRYLTRIISGKTYSRFRAFAKDTLRRVPPAYRLIRKVEEATKNLLLPGGWFDALGIRYLGPVSGHSIPELIRMLETARDAGTPCIVHVITDKGKGYRPAEESPGLYHGVSPFDPAKGVVSSSKMTYSKAFGMTMCELASRRNDIAAITAAMTSGTGLDEFAKYCPDRFFDVGIAEEHALVFASGLAAGGMVPVAAIYATFLQRALDPVYHDICLQNLPVVMALDRAGAVEDGPTHHGIYDLSFLRALPNLTIFEPMDEGELRDMLFCAVSLGSPAVIRYPRGSSGRETDLTQPVRPVTPGKAAIRRQGRDLAIWSSGAETLRALETAEILAAEYGLQATVVHAVTIKPLDRDLLRQQAQQMPVFTCEDHVKTGGLASAAAESLQGVAGLTGSFGWPDDGIVPHGKICDLRKNAGLMPRQIAAAIAEILKKNS